MSVLASLATRRLPSEKELETYRGLWVAVEDGNVVGSGKSLRAALNRARAKGYDDPLVFQAPLRGERRAFY